MTLKIAAAVAAVVLSAGAAHAQSAAQPWTGPYVGVALEAYQLESSPAVELGGNWDDETPAFSAEFGDTWAEDIDGDGFGGAVFAGYSHQYANNIVLGAEVSYAVMDASADRSTGQIPNSQAFSLVTYAYENSARIDAMATARLLLGYAVSPRLLAYGVVGVSIGDASVSGAVLSGTNGYSKAGGDSQWTEGFTYGVGGAWRINDRLAVRGELTRTDFGDLHFATLDRPGNTFPGYIEGFAQDISLNSLRVGLSYGF